MSEYSNRKRLEKLESLTAKHFAGALTIDLSGLEGEPRAILEAYGRLQGVGGTVTSKQPTHQRVILSTALWAELYPGRDLSDHELYNAAVTTMEHLIEERVSGGPPMTPNFVAIELV